MVRRSGGSEVGRRSGGSEVEYKFIKHFVLSEKFFFYKSHPPSPRNFGKKFCSFSIIFAGIVLKRHTRSINLFKCVIKFGERFIEIKF